MPLPAGSETFLQMFMIIRTLRTTLTRYKRLPLLARHSQKSDDHHDESPRMKRARKQNDLLNDVASAFVD